MEYLAYYRVSTKAQGQSGLGLDAQRQIVLSYIKHNGNIIVGEYTEIESGKNNFRPELMKAINVAKEQNATLVIAKLDRLSRNISFISNLMESHIKFICCDMPDANELTISIFAALAQWERKRISERTREALQAKKRREPEWRPGTNNLTNDGRNKAHSTISQNARETKCIRHAFHFIKPLREQGYSYGKIASMLNLEGYKTRNGQMFHSMQVYLIWKRLAEPK